VVQVFRDPGVEARTVGPSAWVVEAHVGLVSSLHPPVVLAKATMLYCFINTMKESAAR
jgi:hypothetical protein